MKKAEKVIAARLQRAVVGFIIPMMKIPELYKRLETAVAEGKTDAELTEVVAAFPGITDRRVRA